MGISFLFTITRLLTLTSSSDCLEYSVRDTLNLNYTHNRKWDVYEDQSDACLTFISEKADQVKSLELRNELSYPRYQQDHYEEYWQKVYQNLSGFDSQSLRILQDSLTRKVIYEGLDHYETANLLVSFVQDIPYTLIKSDDCLEDDIKPCIGNQKFGLLAPSEFMYELNGDCDTRAVLLYELLNRMGYDTIIVVSREYGHAMIAVDLPIIGDHIEYKGRHYYFWETTAKGWKAGMLPPSYPQIPYWKVALAPHMI